MRVFQCDRCTNPVAFDASSCSACDADLGYDSDQRAVRVMSTSSDPASYRIEGTSGDVWRCLNSAWGCNWVVPAGAGSWCRSCALTRGRPAEGRTGAVEAWIAAEAAKRRLVHLLDDLGLPIEARSEAAEGGLVFDLVDVPGERGVTGHLDGVVTLDLAEVDDQHRERLRRQHGEPLRTVVGHLRHEIGHYYWARLVGQSDDVARFRTMFGDERSDYVTALDRHYAGGSGAWDPEVHVSAYASAHPLEDWAESFAHYLHLIDAVHTAAAHDLVPQLGNRDVGFAEILDRWRPLNTALGAIAESFGARPPYPIEPSGIVVDKLAFVHRQVTAHTTRLRFYAEI
jgi:hypothetical protein